MPNPQSKPSEAPKVYPVGFLFPLLLKVSSATARSNLI